MKYFYKLEGSKKKISLKRIRWKTALSFLKVQYLAFFPPLLSLQKNLNYLLESLYRWTCSFGDLIATSMKIFI